jgi:hypothetical protein
MFHIVSLAGRYRVRPTICAATLTPRQKLLKKSHSFVRFPGAIHNDLIRLKRSSQVIPTEITLFFRELLLTALHLKNSTAD